ncbi:response regulator transcription factor [Cohnella endophytica]|nr:helix-turn-helix domain-containing protein [Cohnella endophytica]
MHSIVLIEDEPPTLFMVKDLIEALDLGFEVIGYAFNGEDGEATVRELKPDIVITDIKMPAKDGLSLIGDMTAEGFETEWIILSGYADFEYAVLALRNGVKDYILKPVDPSALQTLFEHIAEKLTRKKMEVEAAYLYRQLHSSDRCSAPSGLRHEGVYTPVLITAGNLVDSMHDGLHAGRHVFGQPTETDFGHFGVVPFAKSWIVQGYSKSHQVLLLATDSPKDVHVRQAVEQWVTEKNSDSEARINALIGAPFSDIHMFSERVQNLYRSLKQWILIGQSHVFTAGMPVVTFENSAEWVYKCSRLTSQSYTAFRNQLLQWERQWQEQNYPQAFVELLMTKIADALPNKAGAMHIQVGDIQELLAASVSQTEAVERFANLAGAAFGEEPLGSKRAGPLSDVVESIEAYLTMNYFLPVSYDSLQERFGYHKDYLSYLFRQHKGISPNKYITMLRVENAKRILRDIGELTLKETAERVGYEDPLYFSRVFKNVTGLSPSTFREQFRGDEKGGDVIA